MSSYGPAQKKYYEKHKLEISRKTGAYHRKYNREYYKANKQKILEAAKERRARLAVELEEFKLRVRELEALALLTPETLESVKPDSETS